MNGKCVDRLIGKYCKIVTKEPGEKKATVVTGIVNEIDHEAGFIMIESSQGVGCLNIKTIIAINPKKKLRFLWEKRTNLLEMQHKLFKIILEKYTAGMQRLKTQRKKRKKDGVIRTHQRTNHHILHQVC